MKDSLLAIKDFNKKWSADPYTPDYIGNHIAFTIHRFNNIMHEIPRSTDGEFINDTILIISESCIDSVRRLEDVLNGAKRPPSFSNIIRNLKDYCKRCEPESYEAYVANRLRYIFHRIDDVCKLLVELNDYHAPYKREACIILIDACNDAIGLLEDMKNKKIVGWLYNPEIGYYTDR